MHNSCCVAMVPERPGNKAQKGFCHQFYCRKYGKNSNKPRNRTYFLRLLGPKGDAGALIYLFIGVLGPETAESSLTRFPLTLEGLNVDGGGGGQL